MWAFYECHSETRIFSSLRCMRSDASFKRAHSLRIYAQLWSDAAPQSSI